MAHDRDLSLSLTHGVGPSPVLFISALSVGALASIENSRCGRTMAQYSGIHAVYDNSEKCRRTTKSNCVAVFTDEVKVVSRRNPQVSVIGDLGHSVVGMGHEEIRRKGIEIRRNIIN